MRSIRTWLTPPRDEDPEIQLRATLIHWLSVTVFASITPLTLLLPVIEDSVRYTLPIYLTALLGTGVIFVSLHSGRIRTASVLFAVLGGLLTLWASFASGGVGSPQLSLAVLVIMLTGFLWSGPAAIGMAVVLSVSLLGLEFARDMGIVPEPFIVASRFTVWAALSSVLALSAVFLQLFVRTVHAARRDAADKSRRLEEELERRAETEASLHRAQKLEALGRLTGGIAHDFNNILTVLLGESEMLEDSAKLGRPLSQEELGQISEIRESAERAAALTSQLLAFSRHKVGTPDVLDPDASIERLEPMLKRLIREDLSFRVALGARGARIRMDAAQLEQVLMNLVLNSRDAMPSGGELVLSTERVRVDGDVAAVDPSAQAGPHVMISVSDTGDGIEAADLDRIFDPFFTTKGVGRGTGLGLASAHGIVTQAGGHIRVESAPHRGTTFRVYFPEVADAPASESRPAREAGSLDGSGTILLCEDDDAVRRITLRTLEGAGYRVFEAESAEAAIAWMRNDATPIDLLISDVILPRMNGGVLAGVVVAERPGVRVLLVSGYTANVLEDSGVPSDVELLEKPFKPETLLARVAALLREPPSR